LTGEWSTSDGYQRGHKHAMLTPDRRWIILTAGDTGHRPQIFLLDAADLKDTQGYTSSLLSPTGAHDISYPATIVE
jgi:hypothetical protein